MAATKGRIEQVSFGRDCFLTIRTQDQGELRQVAEIYSDKEFEVKISKVKKHRSLDSNSYMWVLIGKIASKVMSDKDSIYKIMLRRYGQFITMKIPVGEVERLKSFGEFFDIIDENTSLNAETGEWKTDYVFVNLYIGSSAYSQEQMNAMIEGVVSEAKDLGIETLSDEELARMRI